MIAQASHSPSPAPGEESHAAVSSGPAQEAPSLPAVQAIGSQLVRSGMVEARVTMDRSGRIEAPLSADGIDEELIEIVEGTHVRLATRIAVNVEASLFVEPF